MIEIMRTMRGRLYGESHTQVVWETGAWVCSCGDTSEESIYNLVKLPNLRDENNEVSVACTADGHPGGDFCRDECY